MAYERVKLLEFNREENLPVGLIRGTILLRDSKDYVLQLKLKNNSGKVLKGFSVSYDVLNENGEVMLTGTYVYENVTAQPGALFGEDVTIEISTEAVGGVEVKEISQVLTEDVSEQKTASAGIDFSKEIAAVGKGISQVKNEFSKIEKKDLKIAGKTYLAYFVISSALFSVYTVLSMMVGLGNNIMSGIYPLLLGAVTAFPVMRFMEKEKRRMMLFILGGFDIGLTFLVSVFILKGLSLYGFIAVIFAALMLGLSELIRHNAKYASFKMEMVAFGLFNTALWVFKAQIVNLAVIHFLNFDLVAYIFEAGFGFKMKILFFGLNYRFILILLASFAGGLLGGYLYRRYYNDSVKEKIKNFVEEVL